MERVFVYGTLRRGGCRDMTKNYPDSVFVSSATRLGTLHDLGEYPGLRLTGTTTVHGELFDVDEETLELLDALEGFVPEHPELGEYVRVRTQVTRSDGEVESVFVYEINESFLPGCAIIADGDWIRHRAAPLPSTAAQRLIHHGGHEGHEGTSQG